jgi:hypothetical protein
MEQSLLSEDSSSSSSSSSTMMKRPPLSSPAGRGSSSSSLAVGLYGSYAALSKSALTKRVGEIDEKPPNLIITLSSFFLMVTLIFSYTTCAYVLTDFVSYMSEATHFASVHGILSFIITPCSALLVRLVSRPLPRSFPVTYTVAIAPQIIISAVNSLLLVFLGVESWINAKLEDDKSYSALGIVQILAVIESGFMALLSFYVGFRLVSYLKRLREQYARAQQLAAQQRRLQKTGSLYTSPFPSQRRIFSSDPLSPFVSTSTGSSSRFDQLAAVSKLGSTIDLSSARDSSESVDTNQISKNNDTMTAPIEQVSYLSERIEAMERNEENLMSELRSLSVELEKALALKTTSIDGSIAVSMPGNVEAASLSSLLRKTLDEVTRQTENSRSLYTRCNALEERCEYLESELRRASQDVQKLRTALKEEKKKNDKLFATLDLEREANAQAQTVIGDLTNRVSTLTPAREPTVSNRLMRRQSSGRMIGLQTPGKQDNSSER